MFGGAYFNLSTNRHIVVDERLWTFDFEKFEWSVLPSLTMLRPTYFHAAAMNEVNIQIQISILFIFIFSGVKSGHTVVLLSIHDRLMVLISIVMNHVQQQYIQCILVYRI
jgi:hypothetical protein